VRLPSILGLYDYYGGLSAKLGKTIMVDYRSIAPKKKIFFFTVTCHRGTTGIRGRAFCIPDPGVRFRGDGTGMVS
jgi:hypothetical protein